MDDLIGYECDAAHDEQHRTDVLRDFEAFVFHGCFVSSLRVVYAMVPPAAPRMAVMT